jgi:hypothetical protein
MSKLLEYIHPPLLLTPSYWGMGLEKAKRKAIGVSRGAKPKELRDFVGERPKDARKRRSSKPAKKSSKRP